MSLVPMREILRDARNRKYAVGYFESWDYDSLKVTVRAAQEVKSPLIIGFGGHSFMGTSGLDEVKIASFAQMGKIMVESFPFPAAFILNEVPNLRIIKTAMGLGFNCLMFDGSSLALEENIKLTAEIVRVAAKSGIDVEGQIGRIPSFRAKTVDKGLLTSCQEAAHFVEKTKVNALAISIGNIHELTTRKFSVDLQRLEEINRLVNVPLVMHGGSGFPDSLVIKVVKRGVYKFNVGTILKKVFLEEIKKVLTEEDLTETNPQDLIDSIAGRDIFRRAYLAVKELIKKKLRIYGSVGKV